MNIKKLEKLAAHLKTGPLSMPYIELLHELRKQPFHGKWPPCFPFVFNELPHLFKEWQHWQFGLVIYIPQQKLSIDEAIPLFFEITTEVSQHLFYPGTKNVNKYGGKDLTLFSRPRDVADQIYQLIQRIDTG